MELENASLFPESHESHAVGENSFAFLLFSREGTWLGQVFRQQGVRGRQLP